MAESFKKKKKEHKLGRKNFDTNSQGSTGKNRTPGHWEPRKRVKKVVEQKSKKTRVLAKNAWVTGPGALTRHIGIEEKKRGKTPELGRPVTGGKKKGKEVRLSRPQNSTEGRKRSPKQPNQ